jgi:DNA repair protein RecO (recombination protein O)
MLSALGYALPLERDIDSGAPINAAESYHYAYDRGPRRAAEPHARWPVVRGATLIALATENYPDAETAAEAKRLMRSVLDHYLEERRIFSRRVVQDLAALDEERERE